MPIIETETDQHQLDTMPNKPLLSDSDLTSPPELPIAQMPLTDRLQRTMEIVLALVLGKSQLLSLDASECTHLTDFFQRPDGTLDVRKLILTIMNTFEYWNWRNDVHWLLQLPDIPTQLHRLSGQEALTKSKEWREIQAAAQLAFQEANRKVALMPKVVAQMRIAQHGLYLGNARTTAMVLGLFWLDAKASENAERLFNVLSTYSAYSVFRRGPLSEENARLVNEFRQLIDQLKQLIVDDQPIFTLLPSPFLVDKHTLEEQILEAEGDYLLKTAHHVLMLSSRIKEGRQVYYLYDPHVGETHLSGANAIKNREALNNLLYHYLSAKNSLTDSQTRAQYYGIDVESIDKDDAAEAEGEEKEHRYRFEIYKVDLNQAKVVWPALNKLRSLLDAFPNKEQQEAAALLLDDASPSIQLLDGIKVTVEADPSADEQLTDIALATGMHFDLERLNYHFHQSNNSNSANKSSINERKISVPQVIAPPNSQNNRRPSIGTDHHLTSYTFVPTKTAARVAIAIGRIPYKKSTPGNVTKLSHHGGSMMQKYGYTRGFYELIQYIEILEHHDLAEHEREELISRCNMAIASLTTNVFIDSSQFALGKLNERLARKASHRIAHGVPIAKSYLGRLRFNAGTKLSRLGLPLLSIAGSGFDIHNAYDSFSTLSSTTEKKARQDLIVSGSFSVIGSAVGIGTAIACALGGTAAVVAGPVALAAGVALIISAQLYSAVRQIEELKKYVQMTLMKELHSGWLLFWGRPLDVAILNEATYYQTLEQVREQYDRQLAQYAKQFIQEGRNISTLYYSRGNITLQPHAYKQLMGQSAQHTLSNRHTTPMVYYTESANIKDKIKPDESESELHQHNQERYFKKPRYINTYLKDSAHKFYTPNDLQSTDDKVNANNNAGNIGRAQFVGQYQQRVAKIAIQPVEDEPPPDQITPPLPSPIYFKNNQYYSLMGDFNGDGHHDIGYFSPQGLHLLYADKNGGYIQSKLSHTIDTIGSDFFNHPILVSDIDNDQRDDIITFTVDSADATTTTVDIWLAQPDGSFTTLQQTLACNILKNSTTPEPISGDIDGDGYADLVSFNEGKIWLYYGTKTGIFQPDTTPLLPEPIEPPLLLLSQSVPFGMPFTQRQRQIYSDIDRNKHRQQSDSMPIFSEPSLSTPSIPTVLEVAARRPGRETDERRQLGDSANTRSQQRGGFKGEGYIPLAYFTTRYIRQSVADINGDGFDDVISFSKQGEIHTLLGNNNRQKKFIALAAQLCDPLKKIFNHAEGFKRSQIQLRDMNADGRADLLAIKNDGSYLIAHGQVDGQFGSVMDSQQYALTHDHQANNLAIPQQQHILGVTRGELGKEVLLSLNTQGEINAHPFISPLLKERTTWFKLDDGNDDAIGNWQQKNLFEVGAGTKKFTGGRYADSFLLMGKAAPVQPSIFDGGSDPASPVIPLDDNDIVMAMAKYIDGWGYYIDLQQGYAGYIKDGNTDNIQQIAKLRRIENAQGHKATDDILIGDQRGNLLNGAGSKDTLIGQGGNDLLILSEGMAIGGTGIDSYRILQNTQDKSVLLTVQETAHYTESSNILLDYQADKIESIKLRGEDAVIRLRNDNHSITRLELQNVYHSEARHGRKRLKNNFLLYTSDGFLIKGWPSSIAEDLTDDQQIITLKAKYQPNLDRGWQDRIAGLPPQKIRIEQRIINQQGQGQITVTGKRGDSISILPKFIQLLLVDTPFSDRQEGDDGKDKFWSIEGNDTLVGKSGADLYVIKDEKNSAREIIIDNEDNADPENIAQDLLLFPLPFEQISITQQNDDIVLSRRTEPESYLRVRIRNFMKHERYRHLSLLSKESGAQIRLYLDDAGKVLLGQIAVTDGDDRVLLYHETALNNGILDALAGDDVIIDYSANDHTLKGGAGNDLILVKRGNNTLQGDEGDDLLYGGIGNDILCGGTGNDTLEGAEGDDTYLYRFGDGYDVIEDTSGSNTVKFFDEIRLGDLQFNQERNDLLILLPKGAMDQPYVTNFVKFLDGNIIVPTFRDAWNVSRNRDYRYAYDDEAIKGSINDIAYILDNLPLLGTISAALDPDKIILMGHSLGGNVAHIMGFQDPRIKAIVDIDSKITERKIFGRVGVPSNPFGKPILFIRGMMQYQEDVGDQLIKIPNATVWRPHVQHRAFLDEAYFTKKIDGFGTKGFLATFFNWFFKQEPYWSNIDTDPGREQLEEWFDEYRATVVNWLNKQLKIVEQVDGSY